MGHVNAARLLVVVGLQAEAKIAQGRRVRCICGGGNAASLENAIRRTVVEGFAAIISFGIAGGLAANVRPGTIVIANAIIDADDKSLPTDTEWGARLAAKLPSAIEGAIAGVDQPAVTLSDKAMLRQRTGAVAVDMESHIAARIAVELGLPFAALRVVADDAQRVLPPAALVGMKADGSTDIVAVLRSLSAKPGQLPALIQTAIDAGRAMSQLKKSRQMLDHFAF